MSATRPVLACGLTFSAALLLACSGQAPRPTSTAPVRKADAELQKERYDLLVKYIDAGVIRKIQGNSVYVNQAYRGLPLEDKQTLAKLFFVWHNDLPLNPTPDEQGHAETIWIKDHSTHNRLASYDRFDGFDSDE